MNTKEREKELRATVKRAAKYKRKWWVTHYGRTTGQIGAVWPHYLTRQTGDGRQEMWHPYLADPKKCALFPSLKRPQSRMNEKGRQQ